MRAELAAGERDRSFLRRAKIMYALAVVIAVVAAFAAGQALSLASRVAQDESTICAIGAAYYDAAAARADVNATATTGPKRSQALAAAATDRGAATALRRRTSSCRAP